MPRETRTARPTTASLREFLSDVARAESGLPVDPPILRALALADALEAPYATRSAAAYSRRLAREAVMLASRRPEREARAAWRRLNNATGADVDHTGEWLVALRAELELIIAPRAADRAAYRAEGSPRPAASHLSRDEQAYHRELRSMFRLHDALREIDARRAAQIEVAA